MDDLKSSCECIDTHDTWADLLTWPPIACELRRDHTGSMKLKVLSLIDYSCVFRCLWRHYHRKKKKAPFRGRKCLFVWAGETSIWGCRIWDLTPWGNPSHPTNDARTQDWPHSLISKVQMIMGRSYEKWKGTQSGRFRIAISGHFRRLMQNVMKLIKCTLGLGLFSLSLSLFLQKSHPYSLMVVLCKNLCMKPLSDWRIRPFGTGERTHTQVR